MYVACRVQDDDAGWAPNLHSQPITRGQRQRSLCLSSGRWYCCLALGWLENSWVDWWQTESVGVMQTDGHRRVVTKQQMGPSGCCCLHLPSRIAPRPSRKSSR